MYLVSLYSVRNRGLQDKEESTTNWDTFIQVMDLRDYFKEHYMVAYEGFEEFRLTALGSANKIDIYEKNLELEEYLRINNSENDNKL